MEERLTLRLPSELLERAEQRAQQEHRSVANLIRLALIRYLDEGPRR